MSRKKNASEILTERKFSNRDLAQLIAPLLMEQFLNMLVGMVDMVMISGAGEAAISGVSIVNEINNLAIQVLGAVGGGGAVIISQYLGYRDRKTANRAVSQLITLTLLISVLIGGVCTLFHSPILEALYGSVEADVMESAKTYFWITALSFPFLGLYNSCTAVFRSMKQTRVTMYASILMNGINVAGNFIGVYVLHLGVAGVAVPTLVSRIAAAALMLTLCVGSRYELHAELREVLHWDPVIQHKIVSIALPNGIESGMFQVGKILVSTIVATFGTMQIAANAAAGGLTCLCYTTENAMQLAIVTVAGQCVGANDYRQTRYYIRKMLGIAWVLAIVSNIALMAVFPAAVRIYHLSPETESITRTITLMECVAIAVIHTPAFVLPCALRAAGDAKFTMYFGILSMFAARVGCAFLLGKVLGLGVVGTRIAMYLDWGLRTVFFVWRYRSGKWTAYRVVDKN